MEIKIALNDHKYRYDVYQMFNIYFALDELNFGSRRKQEYLTKTVPCASTAGRNIQMTRKNSSGQSLLSEKKLS